MPQHTLSASPPAFLDIEASGFGSASYPIEVGIVLPDGASYCSLIRPEPDWRHWDAGAEQVHGIDRARLFAHGRKAAEVATALNQRLLGQTVYTDAWYHDYVWLSRLFDAAERSPCFVLQDLRVLLDTAAMQVWDQIQQQVRAELHLTRHRASNDARVLQQTLLRVVATHA
ncbi:hypothetical protein [Chitinimonas sp. BJYL2]|uniref:3'-5' exonuclease n=1 Tax=Chitinimonas sp. BJYL2 TaxID=2976696 RepID=UPI0022B3086D|nr:hypothetical protein [Chitinimonas sp. BJYL2]